MLRSLTHYWRSHTAVAAGAAVACAALTGALLVGDSLRGSLRSIVLESLGRIDAAVVAARPLREALAQDLAESFEGVEARAAPALLLSGAAVHAERETRSSEVSLVGVDDRFLGLFPRPATPRPRATGRILPARGDQLRPRRRPGRSRGRRAPALLRAAERHPKRDPPRPPRHRGRRRDPPGRRRRDPARPRCRRLLPRTEPATRPQRLRRPPPPRARALRTRRAGRRQPRRHRRHRPHRDRPRRSDDPRGLRPEAPPERRRPDRPEPRLRSLRNPGRQDPRGCGGRGFGPGTGLGLSGERASGRAGTGALFHRRRSRHALAGLRRRAPANTAPNRNPPQRRPAVLSVPEPPRPKRRRRPWSRQPSCRETRPSS